MYFIETTNSRTQGSMHVVKKIKCIILWEYFYL
jgi:hypothetical protein